MGRASESRAWLSPSFENSSQGGGLSLGPSKKSQAWAEHELSTSWAQAEHEPSPGEPDERDLS